jgi:murein DD-endopeptidase MepM/ murein hydrolase activator NlpD
LEILPYRTPNEEVTMNDGNKRSGKDRFVRFIEGKGFYIVLFLCVAVIGVSAWSLNLTMRRTESDLSSSLEETLQNVPVITIPTPAPPKLVEPTPVPVPEQDAIAPPKQTEPVPSVKPVETPAASAPPKASAAPKQASSKIPDTFIWPVNGTIEQPYAMDALVYDRTMQDWRTHNGVDITANLGDKVKAVAAGVVESVISEPLFGTSVTVLHSGGLRSVYRNLAVEPPVGEGQQLGAGDVVGAVGQTSSVESGDVTHLHFEMSLAGKPVNPTEYLPNR